MGSDRRYPIGKFVFNPAVTPDTRAEAIRTACRLAAEGDIILVAGKGHETYQEIAGVRRDFDDFRMVKNELETLASKAGKQK